MAAEGQYPGDWNLPVTDHNLLAVAHVLEIATQLIFQLANIHGSHWITLRQLG
jgi:hypothetical protein